MKNLPPEYPYLGVEASDLELSTTAMIVDNSKAKKLMTCVCKLEKRL